MIGLPKRRQVPPHTTDFELAEAIGQPGCAVCRLADRAAGRFLDALAYEQVNDPGVRDRLRAARGFCHSHAWRFVAEHATPLGTAIIYEDVLTDVVRRLKVPGGTLAWIAGHWRQSSRPTWLARLKPTAPCPACEAHEDAAGRYLGLLAVWLTAAGTTETAPVLCASHQAALAGRVHPSSWCGGSPADGALTRPDAEPAGAEVAGRLAPVEAFVKCSRCATRAGGAAWCLPHLRAFAPTAPLEAAEAARSGFLTLAADVLAALAEQIRQADYRFRAEPRGPAQLAWLQAVAAVAGAPSLASVSRDAGPAHS